MPGWRISVAVAGFSALLVGGGVAAWAWGRFDGPIAAIQRALAPPGHTDAEQLGAVERESLVRLAGENAVLRTRLEEYQAIRGEGGVPPERVVVARARILARSQRAGRRYLELGAGAVDGVAKGMAVAAGWTLVGTVAGLQEGRCLVQELSDHQSRVAASIVGALEGAPKAVAEGVLAGTGRRGGLALEFVEHRPELVIAPGMAVVTAGTDGRLPPGLALGTIASADRGGDERWTISVAPGRDPEQAESLLVLRFPGR